jgi:hypothetical protein
MLPCHDLACIPVGKRNLEPGPSGPKEMAEDKKVVASASVLWSCLEREEERFQ